MKIIITKDYDSMSRKAADLVEELLNAEPEGLFSIPGGESPAGLAKEFCLRVREGRIDPTGVKFVQLDDWVGIGPDDEGSCSNFLRDNLFSQMSKPFADVFTFNGAAGNIDAQLQAQDAFIRKYGPITAQVLGIGMNGHLGFNEDGVDFSLRSHRIPLSGVTLGVQKKYFGGKDLPLTEGITMGVAQIMESKTVILLASGEKKAEIMAKALTEPVSNQIPATVLQNHANCIYLLDEAAASRLPDGLANVEHA